MLNLGSDYRINRDGTVSHDAANRLRKKNQKYSFGFYHPVFVVALLLMFFALDLAMNVQLFDAILNDNQILRILSIAALLAGLDICPIFLGKELKKRNYFKRYGIENKDSKIGIYIFTIGFILAYCAYCLLRIVTKDIVMPNLDTMQSIFGDVSVTDNVNEIALPYAIVACIFPLITSLGSFAVSYVTTVNPVQEKLDNINRKIIRTQDMINRYDSHIKDYELHSNYREMVMNKDFNEYTNAINAIKLRTIELADLVRREIAVRIQDPVAVSALTQIATENLSQLSVKLDDMLANYQNTKCLSPSNEVNVYLPENTNDDLIYEYDAQPTSTSTVYINS